jgi:hypothetical protein
MHNCNDDGMKTPSKRRAASNNPRSTSENGSASCPLTAVRGTPKIIRAVELIKPTKIVARNNMKMSDGTGVSLANPALMMVSSLTKTPNGGHPVIANTPRMRNVEETGITLIAPVTLPISFVRYAIRILPAVRKRSVLPTALLRR